MNTHTTRDTAVAFVPDEPFFDVPRTTVQTSQGPVQLPILYRKTRNLNAFFMVDMRRVSEVLRHHAGDALVPACTWGSRALVGLACYEYQDTSVGPYNELGLAVAVVPRGVKPGLRHWLQALQDVERPGHELGFHVLHLPVTTPVACAAGREIWGLPKFVTPIRYERTQRHVEMVLADPHALHPDDHILRLSGRLGPSMPAPPMSVALYATVADQWQRATVNVRGGVHLHTPGTVRLSVGQCKHPMVHTLRALGLDGARPLCVTDTDAFQSRLNQGRGLGLVDVPSPPSAA